MRRRKWSWDYKNRCGNCHSFLRPEENYCKCCGTKRGKGKFLPYKNMVYCVYGPPVKEKYKCSICGYLWIECLFGYSDTKHCPMCGKAQIDLLEHRHVEFPTYIGMMEPYDIGNEPILFDETQIQLLLKRREDPDTSIIGIDKLRQILQDIGAVNNTESDEDNFPRTEKEGDQVVLAEIILRLKGRNIRGYSDIQCPHCSSDILAGLGYAVRDKQFNTITVIHNPSSEDALLYHNRGMWIDYDDSSNKHKNYLAYICLQCGKRFGILEYPLNLEEIFKIRTGKTIGNKNTFAIEYSFIDADTTEISMYHNNQNILEFERAGILYTTRWNLDDLAIWLREFINNMCDDPYPVEAEGRFAAQKDISAREFDADDFETFDAYYNMLDEWIARHRWHSASSGAILADLYFQQIGNTVEISWNNHDAEDGIHFTTIEGGFVIDKEIFVGVVNAFLNAYSEK